MLRALLEALPPTTHPLPDEQLLLTSCDSPSFRLSIVAACDQAVKDLMKQNEALDGLELSYTMQVQGSVALSNRSLQTGLSIFLKFRRGGCKNRVYDLKLCCLASSSFSSFQGGCVTSSRRQSWQRSRSSSRRRWPKSKRPRRPAWGVTCAGRDGREVQQLV